MQIINNNKAGEQDKRQLKRAFDLIVSNWYILVVALVISLGYYIYSATTAGINGAIARLQISLKYNESNTKNYSDYSDEMTGINSPTLIEQTIESLHLDVSYFKTVKGEYKEIVDSIPFKITMGVVSPDLEDRYIKFKVLNNKEFEVTYEKLKEKIVEKCFFDSTFSNIDLKLEVERNLPDSAFTDQMKNTDFFVQMHDKASLISKYQSSIQTKLTKDLAVLQVTYEDIIPKRAVDFLDTLAKAYLNKAIKSQIDRNMKMVAGIDKLLIGTDNVLQGIEDSLRKYSQHSGIMNESLEGQKYVSVLTNVMIEKSKVEFQVVALNELEKYIIDNKSSVGLPPPFFAGVDDPFLRASLSELYSMQLDRKSGLFEYTEKSKTINKLDNSYENRKKDVLEYVKNAEKALSGRVTYMQKEIDDMDNHARTGYTTDQLALMNLQRQLKMNEAMYMNLLEKRSAILVSQSAMAPEYKIFEASHIIAYAHPADKGNPLYYLGIALLIGLVLIYVKNFFYEKIENMEYLKTKTGIPILGEMAYISPGNGQNQFNSLIDVHKHPLGGSLLGAIRTNLEFELAGKKSKVILITSHTSAEGKTFNAVNLGAILSKTRKKVLLLDMDFHKPNLANVLEFKNSEVGMNDIFNGTCSIQNAIVQTGINNLDVIIAQHSIEDPSEKILSERTKEIIEYARDNYDYVIIDTPPVGIISDALTLMQFTDLNIYVLNAITPYKNALTQVDEIIEKKQFKIHLILNKVRIRRLQYYSKYYQNYRYARAS